MVRKKHMLKRQHSIEERLAPAGKAIHDTVLNEERIKERAGRVPRARVTTSVRPKGDGERLLEEFRDDCLQELWLDDHPKAHLAFNLALELAGHDLATTNKLLGTLADLMVPRDPVTGWQEVAWHVQRAADACEGRKARHACIKFVIATLIDMLQEPDDE